MRFPGRAFISLFICLLTHSANSSGTSTKLWPGMISEISFPKTSVFAVKKPSFPKTSVFGPMNNHTRMRLVLPQKGAFLPGTWRSPAWLTLLNSIKEDEVQSLLWALQPYFIHPLQISHIFEILCDTPPLLNSLLFSWNAFPSENYYASFNTQVTPSVKPSLPCLGLGPSWSKECSQCLMAGLFLLVSDVLVSCPRSFAPAIPSALGHVPCLNPSDVCWCLS